MQACIRQQPGGSVETQSSPHSEHPVAGLETEYNSRKYVQDGR
jgi:hypothetical protein